MRQIRAIRSFRVSGEDGRLLVVTEFREMEQRGTTNGPLWFPIRTFFRDEDGLPVSLVDQGHFRALDRELLTRIGDPIPKLGRPKAYY